MSKTSLSRGLLCPLRGSQHVRACWPVHLSSPTPRRSERAASVTLQPRAYTSLGFQVNKHGTNGCQRARIKTCLQLLGTQREAVSLETDSQEKGSSGAI